MRKFDMAYFTASCDEPDGNKVRRIFGSGLPILSDPSRETAKAFGVVTGEGKNAVPGVDLYIGKDGKNPVYRWNCQSGQSRR